MTSKKKITLLVAGLLIGLIGFLGFQTFYAPQKKFAEKKRLNIETETGFVLSAKHAENIYAYSDAASFYEKALSFGVQDKDFRKRLYSHLIFSGDFEKAKTFIETYKNGYEKDRLGQFLFLVDLVKKGNFAEASVRLGKMKEDKVALPLLQAWILAAQNKKKEALQALQKMKQKETEKFYQIHAFHLHVFFGEAEQAEKILEEFDEKEKLPPGFVDQVSNFYCHQKKPAIAVLFAQNHLDLGKSYIAESLMKEIEKTKKCNPPLTAQQGFAEALSDLSLAMAHPKTRDVSLFISRLALHLDKDFHFARIIIGELLEKQRSYEQAIALYNEVPAGHYLYPSALFKIARIYRKLGQNDLAEQKLRHILKKYPDYLFATFVLGELYLEQKEYEDVQELYLNVLETVDLQHIPWEVFYFIGLSYDLMDQPEKVEQYILTALEKSPQNPQLLNFLGYFWIEQGKNQEEALLMIQKALAQRPIQIEFWDSYGWALFKTGEVEKAANILEIAVQREAGHPELHNHLGDVYHHLGRTREAVYQWKRALYYKDQGIGLKDENEIEKKIENVE